MGKTEKLDQLTSLRFFAAAMIVVHHFYSAEVFGFGDSVGRPTALGAGVSFFFVLSGFILAYVYPRLNYREDTSRFLIARFARIWPAHAATFLLAFWLLSLDWQTNYAIANLALVHAWIPDHLFYFSYNSPSWSISAEFFFYLAFPFLIHRWEHTWRKKLLLSGCLVIFIVILSNLGALPDELSSIIYINPISRIFEFVFGIFVAFYWRKHKNQARWNSYKATALEIVTISICSLSMYLTPMVQDWAGASWLGPGFSQWLGGSGSMFSFGLLIYIMAMGRGKISNILVHPYLIVLGEISFSLYLLHQILIRYYLLIYKFLPPIQNIIALALFSLILLLSSYLMWALIEMPARRLILRKRKIHSTPDMEKSWRDNLILNPKTLIATLLLVFAVLPLYPSITAHSRAVTADPLAESVLSGDMNKVGKMLKLGIDPNYLDSSGIPPLVHAAWNGKQDIAAILIAYGANPNGQDILGNTALMVALQRGHLDTVKFLASNGASVNMATNDGSTVLMDCAWNGNMELVLLMLSLGADVSAKNKDGYTALNLARMRNNTMVADLLSSKAAK